MLNKKGDLSINVIVVAVIALVVLIVLIVIFAGRINLFNQGVNSCTDKGGIQYSSNVDCIQEGGTPSGPFIDRTSGKPVGTDICCIIKK